MCILAEQGGILRNDYWGRQNWHGPSQAMGDCRLATPKDSQGCLILFRIWKLLPEIHQWIWRFNHPTQWTTQEGRKIWMDTTKATSIWHSQGQIPRGTCPSDAWPTQAFCGQIRCIQICIRSGTVTTGHQWWLAPMQCYYFYYSTLYFILSISLSHNVLMSSLFTIMYFTI